MRTFLPSLVIISIIVLGIFVTRNSGQIEPIAKPVKTSPEVVEPKGDGPAPKQGKTPDSSSQMTVGSPETFTTSAIRAPEDVVPLKAIQPKSHLRESKSSKAAAAETKKSSATPTSPSWGIARRIDDALSAIRRKLSKSPVPASKVSTPVSPQRVPLVVAGESSAPHFEQLTNVGESEAPQVTKVSTQSSPVLLNLTEPFSRLLTSPLDTIPEETSNDADSSEEDSQIRGGESTEGTGSPTTVEACTSSVKADPGASERLDDVVEQDGDLAWFDSTPQYASIHPLDDLDSSNHFIKHPSPSGDTLLPTQTVFTCLSSLNPLKCFRKTSSRPSYLKEIEELKEEIGGDCGPTFGRYSEGSNGSKSADQPASLLKRFCRSVGDMCELAKLILSGHNDDPLVNSSRPIPREHSGQSPGQSPGQVPSWLADDTLSPDSSLEGTPSDDENYDDITSITL